VDGGAYNRKILAQKKGITLVKKQTTGKILEGGHRHGLKDLIYQNQGEALRVVNVLRGGE